MKSYSYLLLMGVALLMSCTPDGLKQVKSENLEVYSVKDVDGEYEKGPLSFSESRVYDERGNEIKHLIRQKDNSLFREAFMYDKGDLIRSNYYNSDSLLISYYTYELEAGLIKTKKSFDAQNDELLRIETYEYNSKGLRNKKTISEASGTLSRTMVFAHDQYGNEIQVTVRDGTGKIILNEMHKILSYDVDKRWLEKWSFFDDKPISYRRRTLDYY